MMNKKWENQMDVKQVFELRAKTTAFFGVGALSKINLIADELTDKGVKKVIIVAGRSSYKLTGIKDKVETILSQKGIEFTVYNDSKPNPNTDMVDAIKKQGMDFGAQAIFGIGGGSNIDAAKSAAIIMHKDYQQYNCAALYEQVFIPDSALPIIAINTTHGTGTEVNRFAVVSIEEKEYKPAIAYDCIYPMYSINDPSTTVSLPWNQTTYTAIDAVNHVVEAATTQVSTPYSILLASETIRLIAKYLPIAQKNPQNIEARYFLMYASSIAGIAFDNGLLHFTHALEHPLSGVKTDLTHGLGLAMLLPAVIVESYKAKPKVLSEILAPLTGDTLEGTAGESMMAGRSVEKWLNSVGVDKKLSDVGFVQSDIDKLVDLTFKTPSLDGLLACAPVNAEKPVVRRIFENSFKQIH